MCHAWVPLCVNIWKRPGAHVFRAWSGALVCLVKSENSQPGGTLGVLRFNRDETDTTLRPQQALSMELSRISRTIAHNAQECPYPYRRGQEEISGLPPKFPSEPQDFYLFNLFMLASDICFVPWTCMVNKSMSTDILFHQNLLGGHT